MQIGPLWKVGRVVVAVVAVVAALMWLVAQVPALNPFTTETQDRTGPAMLQAVRDLSQYHAAEGDFQVIVDLEHDVAWVPDAIAGNRTLFVARGSVSAYIDLGTLSDQALTVDEERRTVQVRLPDPKLAKPNIDQEHTYLYSQERGVFDRIKSLFETADQREFYVLAEKRIGEAAEEAGLTARAERNTRQMLTGMFTTLGYTTEFPPDDNT